MASKHMQRVDHYNRVLRKDTATGRMVNRIVDQVAGTATGQQQKRYANFQAQQIVPTYLRSGGQLLQFNINGEMGQISRVWVQFSITIANAPVQLLPAFMWIDKLNSYKDSTNSKGQTTNWASILFALGNLTPAQMTPMANVMKCDYRDAWSVEPYQIGTYTIYVPLYDNCLLTNSNLHFYPKNILLSIQAPVYGCVEVGDPLNVSLTSASLLLEETLVPVGIAASIAASHSRPVQRVFLDWQVLPAQPVTVSANSAGTPINITMTGLEGVSPFLVYGLQSVTDNLPANGAIKRFIKLGSAGSQAKVSILTPASVPIMNQPIDPYQQLMITGESSYGTILDEAWSSLYFIDYTVDRIASFNGVIGAGWRKVENNEILQIIPGNYVAEVPRVVTITTLDGSGAAVPATGGSYALQYTNGYGASYTSGPIAYNASQADVVTALQGLQIFGGSIVVPGATNVNVAGGLVLTITRLQEYDTAVQGARWTIVNSTLRAASSILLVNLTDVGGSTVVGIPPGQYNPYILFPKFVFLTIEPDRSTYIRDVSAESISTLSLA